MPFIHTLLTWATVAAQLFLAAGVIYLVAFQKKYPAFLRFIARHSLAFAFAVALTATSGSLFYSQVMHFPPCELCWYQRIFMYPLVLIFGLALAKRKDFRAVDYALVLAGAGFFISLYHNVLYYSNGGLSALCDIMGTSVSCIKRYIFELGYITIPLMALTAFACIILLLAYNKRARALHD